MSEMIIAAYIFIFFLAVGLLFLACKLGTLIKEAQNTLADREARISSMRTELCLLKNSVDCLKDRVEILEGDK